ncbi:hypothetical protein DM02DRAFT_49909 [Periconia macrospinosa]|uniref:Uncharacterized protein n=1 Tax=Periconia macrospinosa TaxID=97972 RepID=A0A2V1CX16_9PLEO|nr:hypothetical protein DM02DRAFT_49909 [Periconia macrospinosa]
MRRHLLLSLLAHLAIATPQLGPLRLTRRQSIECESSDKKCGDGCIPLLWTCCPDGSGGCKPGDYCASTINSYGCCPIGETCRGGGGATTCTRSVAECTAIFGDDVTTTLKATGVENAAGMMPTVGVLAVGGLVAAIL